MEKIIYSSISIDLLLLLLLFSVRPLSVRDISTYRNNVNPIALASFLTFNSKCVIECTGEEAFGMESGAIKHQQITAYSQYSENHGPENARLNHVADGRKMGAWSAKTNDLDQWLQVDFGRDVKITKFVTQGRQDYKQWVKSYALSFSTEKEPVFQTYQENGQDKVTKCTQFNTD